MPDELEIVRLKSFQNNFKDAKFLLDVWMIVNVNLIQELK